MSNFETIHRALGRIEGMLEGIDTRLRAGSVRMDRMDTRIAENEKRVWKMAGASSVLVVLTLLAIRAVPWALLVSS